MLNLFIIFVLDQKCQVYKEELLHITNYYVTSYNEMKCISFISSLNFLYLVYPIVPKLTVDTSYFCAKPEDPNSILQCSKEHPASKEI